MIGEINQENLYLLLPSKVCWLASMLVENTKIWHLGPVALYQELEAELPKIQ